MAIYVHAFIDQDTLTVEQGMELEAILKKNLQNQIHTFQLDEVHMPKTLVKVQYIEKGKAKNMRQYVKEKMQIPLQTKREQLRIGLVFDKSAIDTEVEVQEHPLGISTYWQKGSLFNETHVTNAIKRSIAFALDQKMKRDIKKLLETVKLTKVELGYARNNIHWMRGICNQTIQRNIALFKSIINVYAGQDKLIPFNTQLLIREMNKNILTVTVHIDHVPKNLKAQMVIEDSLLELAERANQCEMFVFGIIEKFAPLFLVGLCMMLEIVLWIRIKPRVKAKTNQYFEV